MLYLLNCKQCICTRVWALEVTEPEIQVWRYGSVGLNRAGPNYLIALQTAQSKSGNYKNE